MKRTWPVCLVALLSACAATGPLYQDPPPPPDGYAQVVIYRVASFASAAHASPFEVDGKHVANLNNGGYTHLLVRAGPHTLHCGGKDLLIEAKSGAAYYFRYEVSIGDVFEMPGAFIFVVNSAAAEPVALGSAMHEVSGMHFQAPAIDRLD